MVTIIAEDEFKAIEKVEDMYQEEKIILDYKDFPETQFYKF